MEKKEKGGALIGCSNLGGGGKSRGGNSTEESKQKESNIRIHGNAHIDRSETNGLRIPNRNPRTRGKAFEYWSGKNLGNLWGRRSTLKRQLGRNSNRKKRVNARKVKAEQTLRGGKKTRIGQG